MLKTRQFKSFSEMLQFLTVSVSRFGLFLSSLIPFLKNPFLCLYISCLPLFLSAVGHTLSLLPHPLSQMWRLAFSSLFPPASLSPLFFCEFSILTLCQVEGRGHPGANCSACNGWRKKSGKQFPHRFLARVPSPLLPGPCGDLEKKRETAT